MNQSKAQFVQILVCEIITSLITWMSDQTQTSIPTQQNLRKHWSTIEPEHLAFFTSNFPTESKLFAEFRYESSLGLLNFTQTLKRRTKDRKNSYQCNENLNLLINLPDGNTFWARFTDHDLKLHYDHAKALSLSWFGPWNLYGSFSSTRRLKNSSFKFGGIRHFGNGSVDLRMRFNVGDHRHEEYFYMKSQWRFGAFRIATIEVIDLYRKFLQKNDVAVSYEINKQHSISGLLESDGFRNYQINYWRFGNYFDLLRLGYIYSQNKLQFGLEYDYSIEQSKTKKIEFALQYKPEATCQWAKVKFNSSMEAGIASEWRINERLKLLLGFTWLNATKTAMPSSSTVTLSIN